MNEMKYCSHYDAGSTSCTRQKNTVLPAPMVRGKDEAYSQVLRQMRNHEMMRQLDRNRTGF